MATIRATTTAADGVRHAFLSAADAAARLLGSAEVAARWDQPSALEGWSVSGLSGHLGRAVLTVSRYLDGEAPPAGARTVDAAGYVLAAIDDDDLDVASSLSTSIRARGDEEGAVGPEALAEAVTAGVGTLRARLGRSGARIPGSHLVAVLHGITMTLDEYLATRVVELVVHLDDLTTSVGRAPVAPAQALGIATDVVVEIARRRRGDEAVLRLLARRERAPDGPVAF